MSDLYLDLFHPLVREWFKAKYGSPTDIQDKAWPLIASGKHVLVTAPTGSGKTLAAFLYGLDMLASGKWERGGVKLLYVSPLKALGNDVRENLLTPLREIGALALGRGLSFPQVSVLTRSGDTPKSVRAKMTRTPPDVLITTPESLNIILNSERGHAMFAGLRTVILDEIHAILPTKRGTHTITAVERLTLYAGEFQRIALSATVNPIEAALAFVGGARLTDKGAYENRKVDLVFSSIEKKISVSVIGIRKDETESVFPRLREAIRERVRKNKATLVFTNSRRMCEQITRLINENEERITAYSHHGSLSRELRLYVEKTLRSGGLSAIVATSSLELGIDIGHLDEALLVEAPRSVSSALQRIGRAGHRVGETSVGIIYPLHGLDYLSSAVIARLTSLLRIEAAAPIGNPLDVLCQVILGMCAARPWTKDELYAFLKTSFPYSTLTRSMYELTLGMLSGKYGSVRIGELKQRLTIDPGTKEMRSLRGVRPLLFLSGGTIADKGLFELRVEGSGMKIGELDEEFVWERRVGNAFNLGAQNWQITRIDSRSVEVRSFKGSGLMTPFWKGERPGKEFALAEEEGKLLEIADSSGSAEALCNTLAKDYFTDETASKSLAGFIMRQKEALGGILPHRHRIVCEHVADKDTGGEPLKVVLHTFWGGKVNRAFSIALQAAWDKAYGYAPDVFVDDSALLVAIPHESSGPEIFGLIQPELCESLIAARLPQTAFFGARFRENASIALLLPRRSFGKRTPFWLTRLRSRKLFEAVSRFADFPVTLETIRACMIDDLDIETLSRLLAELRDGEISCVDVHTSSPSPFAASSVWRETNTYMYQGDEPKGPRAPSASPDLVSELVSTRCLVPSIEPSLAAAFKHKLARTEAGYSPSDTDELLAWITERVMIPADEWESLLHAVERDHGIEARAIIEAVSGKAYFILLKGASRPGLVSLDNLEWILAALGLRIREIEILRIADGLAPDADELARIEGITGEQPAGIGALLYSDSMLRHLVVGWLRFYGPVAESEIKSVFGDRSGMFLDVIRTRDMEDAVYAGPLLTGSKEISYCYRENLERLLRLSRKKKREAFAPVPQNYLQIFLATWQGLVYRRVGIDGLKATLEQLFGYSTHVELWEEEILPSRISDYKKSMLDGLFGVEGLIWFGNGKGNLGFCFEEDLDIFFVQGEGIDLSDVLPETFGKYGFWDIAGHSGLESAELAALLWELVWKTEISNTSFETVRKGIANGFKPQVIKKDDRGLARIRGPGFPRWKASRPVTGAWFRLRKSISGENELLEAQERKERVRLLLSRYGILLRGISENETEPFSWKNLTRPAQIMELASEIQGGYFFENLPGPQFMTKEALELLQGGLDLKAVYMMNACDPASLCGSSWKLRCEIGLRDSKTRLPARLPSNHVVFYGTSPVILSYRNFAELQFLVPQDHAEIIKFASQITACLSRDFAPISSIKIERINGERADKSPYAEVLASLGFTREYGACIKRGAW